DRFGVPDRVELIQPLQQTTPTDPVTLIAALGPTDTSLSALPVYQLPQAGRVQIDSEIIGYNTNDSDAGLNMGLSTLSGLSRGLNGTAPAAHGAGAQIRPLDDQQHWTYDDAYWVYGQSPNEVWVKYGDGSVWQQGGQASAPLPQITGVQVTPNGTTATITFSTNVPASAWVEYDTYGSAEASNSQRPAGWWPNYLHKTNLSDEGAPAPATSHSRTLTGLQPGAVYHYRIVARGPAQAVTPDATFVATGVGPMPRGLATPTLPASPTGRAIPTARATPAGTAAQGATPTPTPASTATSVPPSPSLTPMLTATPYPRPNVGVQVAPAGIAGEFQTSITARDARRAGGNNQLQALQFPWLTNATGAVATTLATSVVAPTTVSLPVHPATIGHVVHRITAG
ncbi:MAG TPA: fibronectin type III domain-containing protein, partial [Chloroflexota bacterium]